MIKITDQKNLKILSGILFGLMIIGLIFKINMLVMSIPIGLFSGAIVQMLSNRKRKF